MALALRFVKSSHFSLKKKQNPEKGVFGQPEAAVQNDGKEGWKNLKA